MNRSLTRFLALAVAWRLVTPTRRCRPPATGPHAGGLMLSDCDEGVAGEDTQRPEESHCAAARRIDGAAARPSITTCLVAPPATEAYGCISDPMLGGMGYHYTRGDNLCPDDAIDLLNLQFLLYAPKNGPRKDDVP